MKQKLTLWINKYLNDDLDLREQIFNLLALIGMVLGVAIAISCVITNAGIVNIAINLFASALAFGRLAAVWHHASGRCDQRAGLGIKEKSKVALM